MFYSDDYCAGFDAYCVGTVLDPDQQSAEWRAGYDYALRDHMKMEQSLNDNRDWEF